VVAAVGEALDVSVGHLATPPAEASPPQSEDLDTEPFLWDADTAVDVAYHLRCHLEAAGGEARTRAQSLYARQLLFRDLTTQAAATWSRWQHAAHQCAQDPEGVVQTLLRLKLYPLARRLVDIFAVPQLSDEIDLSELLHLLQTGDGALALRRLAGRGGAPGLALSEALLARVVSLPSKIMLLNFLLSPSNLLPLEGATGPSGVDRRAELLATQQGVRLLFLLPVPLQVRFRPLAPCPALIVESLLMAACTPLLSRVFRRMPEVVDVKMVARYARRAISFGVPPDGSDEFGLNGDPDLGQGVVDLGLLKDWTEDAEEVGLFVGSMVSGAHE